MTTPDLDTRIRRAIADCVSGSVGPICKLLEQAVREGVVIGLDEADRIRRGERPPLPVASIVRDAAEDAGRLSATPPAPANVAADLGEVLEEPERWDGMS